MNILQKIKEFDEFLDDIFPNSVPVPRAVDQYTVAIALKNRSKLVDRIVIPKDNIVAITKVGDQIQVDLDGHRYVTKRMVPVSEGEWPIVEKSMLYLYDNSHDQIGDFPVASYDIPSTDQGYQDYTEGMYGVSLPPTLVFHPKPF